MDLNELLHHHQVAAIQARLGNTEADREFHTGMVSHFAALITELRAASGAPQVRWAEGFGAATEHEAANDRK